MAHIYECWVGAFDSPVHSSIEFRWLCPCLPRTGYGTGISVLISKHIFIFIFHFTLSTLLCTTDWLAGWLPKCHCVCMCLCVTDNNSRLSRSFIVSFFFWFYGNWYFSYAVTSQNPAKSMRRQRCKYDRLIIYVWWILNNNNIIIVVVVNIVIIVIHFLWYFVIYIYSVIPSS